MKILFVNYAPGALLRELRSHGYSIGVVRDASISAIRDLLGNYDVVYYAKFIPPYFDDVYLFLNGSKAPIIYGLHAPYLIYKPFRPSNYLYNIINVSKVLASTVTGSGRILYHALNPYDYYALKLVGRRASYCPLGVDTNEFKPSEKFSEFTLVFVSPRYQKGVDFLPHILPPLFRRLSGIRVILTGRGFLKQIYTMLKKQFPRNVVVAENLPKKEFIEIFSKSHVLLFLSRYEGFSHTLVEALASGMGVVAFDIPGGPREVLKRHGVGYVAKPFDVKEILKGIIEYYKIYSRGEFDDVVLRSRKVAMLFDWSNIAKCFKLMFYKAVNIV